ncbi:hypothetical protein R50072_13570 [Simiduia litorea]
MYGVEGLDENPCSSRSEAETRKRSAAHPPLSAITNKKSPTRESGAFFICAEQGLVENPRGFD